MTNKTYCCKCEKQVDSLDKLKRAEINKKESTQCKNSLKEEIDKLEICVSHYEDLKKIIKTFQY